MVHTLSRKDRLAQYQIQATGNVQYETMDLLHFLNIYYILKSLISYRTLSFLGRNLNTRGKGLKLMVIHLLRSVYYLFCHQLLPKIKKN